METDIARPIDLQVTDFQLHNRRPLPVGYVFAFFQKNLKAMLDLTDNRAVKKDILRTADVCKGSPTIGIFTDYLPDSFQIEAGSAHHDADMDDLNIDLICVNRLPTRAKDNKRSQRLVLLNGAFPTESDLNLFIHYDNANSDGPEFFRSDSQVYLRELRLPERIEPPLSPLMKFCNNWGTFKPAR